MTGTIHPILFNLLDETGNPICSKTLDFGHCNTNSETAMRVGIQNPSEKLPLHIELSKMANFTIEPRIFSVKPLETAPLSIKFKPHQLGALSQRVVLKLRDSQKRRFLPISDVKFPVRLVGEGTPQRVDPETRFSRDKKYVAPLNNFNSSYTFTNEEKQKVATHVTKYNKEIRKAAAANQKAVKFQKSIDESKRLDNPVELGIVPFVDETATLAKTEPIRLGCHRSISHIVVFHLIDTVCDFLSNLGNKYG